MSFSDQNRPGVDSDIVQTQVLRGCDALFPGGLGGKTLLIRGGDVQDAGVPGDIVLQPGQNQTSGALGSITFLRRSTSAEDEILILRASDDVSTGPVFNVYGGTGDPNGSIFAPESSLFFDSTTPGLWIKTTDVSVNSGWDQIATLPDVEENLEETLVLGNTTGALPIVVNNVNSGLFGQNGVSANGTSFVVRGGESSDGIGGTLTVRGGHVTSGTGDGGDLNLQGGNSFGGVTGGQGGDVDITGGTSGGSFSGGRVLLSGGVGGPNAGAFGGSIILDAGDGDGGAGGNINLASGNGGTDQIGGAVTITGGLGSPGGTLTFSAGNGQGTAGGAGGTVLIQGGDGDNTNGGDGGSLTFLAGDATVGGSPTNGGSITLTPGTGAGGGTDGVVNINGKLNVSGLIDPTGLILTENTGTDPDLPVATNEGALYVSDGSNGRTDNALYFKDAVGSHYQIAPEPAGTGVGPVEAWMRASWGYISPSSELAGDELDTVGILNGVNLVTAGDGTSGSGTTNQGPRFVLNSGTTPNTSHAFLESDVNRLSLSSRFLVYFRFGLITTSSDSRVFVGLRGNTDVSSDFANTDSASLNTHEYLGFSTTETPGSMSLVSGNDGVKQEQIVAGVGVIDAQIRWMFIDATVSGQVTIGTLVETGGELVSEATMLVTNPANIPTLPNAEVLVSAGIRSGAVDQSVGLFHVSAISRGDLVAQAFSSQPPLSAVLSVGNTMGANNIVATSNTPFPTIEGADNSSGTGVGLSMVAGNSTGGGGNGGTIQIRSGDHDPATSGAASGELTVGTMDGVGSNNSGRISIFTGDAPGGSVGELVLITGNGGTAGGHFGVTTGGGESAGTVDIVTGDATGTGVDGAVITLEAGDAADGKGGQVQITAGDATGGSNNPGGSIILTPGSGFGGGSDGVVFIDGKLTVTGLIDPPGMVFDHVSAVPGGAPGVGKSTLWVRSSDNALILTNTGGTDSVLSGGGGSIAVQDEGNPVESATTTINFIGGGVTATSPGAGVVEVTIPDTGGESLAQTLAIGNTTGGNGIRVSAGDPLTFNENSSVPGGAPIAGTGKLWVRNDTPNVLVFTDDTGSDTVLGSGGGGGEDLAATLAIGNSTGSSSILISSTSPGIFSEDSFLIVAGGITPPSSGNGHDLTIGAGAGSADSSATGGVLTLLSGDAGAGSTGDGGDILLISGLGDSPGVNGVIRAADNSGGNNNLDFRAGNVSSGTSGQLSLTSGLNTSLAGSPTTSFITLSATSPSAASTVSIRSGAGSENVDGGSIEIISGAGDSSMAPTDSGGDITIQTGFGDPSGAILIQTGDSQTAGTVGIIQIAGGDGGAGNSTGGSVLISGGNGGSASGGGGAVTIQAGLLTGGSTTARINLEGGSPSGAADISIRAGEGGTSTRGGDITIETTDATDTVSGRGGDVIINTGDGGFGGVKGILRPNDDGVTNFGSSSNRWQDIWATNGTIQTSDLREKTEVQDLDFGLDFISSLRPVSFRWEDEKREQSFHFGFIAQEVLKHVSDSHALVTFGEKYGLRYNELIAPLVRAIQELHMTIEAQEAAINELARELYNQR